MHIIFESIKQNEAHANSTPPRCARSSLTGPIYVHLSISIHTTARRRLVYTLVFACKRTVSTRTGCCVIVTSRPLRPGNIFTAIRTLSPTGRPLCLTPVRGREFPSRTHRFWRSYFSTSFRIRDSLEPVDSSTL